MQTRLRFYGKPLAVVRKKMQSWVRLVECLTFNMIKLTFNLTVCRWLELWHLLPVPHHPPPWPGHHPPEAVWGRHSPPWLWRHHRQWWAGAQRREDGRILHEPAGHHLVCHELQVRQTDNCHHTLNVKCYILDASDEWIHLIWCYHIYRTAEIGNTHLS